MLLVFVLLTVYVQGLQVVQPPNVNLEEIYPPNVNLEDVEQAIQNGEEFQPILNSDEIQPERLLVASETLEDIYQPSKINNLLGVLNALKGNANLTKVIISKLVDLNTLTYNQGKTIKARVTTKRLYKEKKLSDKNTQCGKCKTETTAYSTATKQYNMQVKISIDEQAQVDREVFSLNKIMDQLTAMIDWIVCPTGWVQKGRSCYKLISVNYPYVNEGRCLKLGGGLLRLDSSSDAEFLNTTGNGWSQIGLVRNSHGTGNGWMYRDGKLFTTSPYVRWTSSAASQTTGSAGYANRRYVCFHVGSTNGLYGQVPNWKTRAVCEHKLKV